MRATITCLITVFFMLTGLAVKAVPKPGKSAGPKWVLVRNADFDKAPKAREINNGYYLQLYDEQMHVPTMTRYRRIVKKIINESGVQANSELYFGFADAYQKIVFHDISIVREGLRIDKWNPGNINVVNAEDELNNHQLNGMYNAVLIVDDLRKGDVLNIEYSVIGANPIYENKYSDRFIFSNEAPIVNYFTTVVMPKGRKLNYKCFNKAEEPQKSNVGGYEIYDWPKMQVGTHDYPANAPSWYMNFPYAEVTEYNNLSEVAAWSLKVFNNYHYTLPKELKAKMADWGKDTANKAAFTIQAMRFVQDDVRYMGIEIGINSHKPHAPEETYAKRYGDCKDKSILLASILRTQKIPGEVVLVSTVFRDHLNEHLPSPSLFDHVIVKTEIGGRTIYIDPTIPMQRGSIHRIQWPNYGDVLPVSAKTNHTERMPVVDNGTVSIWEMFSIPAHADSAGELRVITDYEGASADNVRNIFAESSLQLIEKYYEEHYKLTYSGAKLSGEVTYDDDDVQNRLTVKEAYRIDSIWKKEDAKIRLSVVARQLYDRITSPDNADGTYPLAQNHPTSMRYTATLHLPSDWSFPDDKLNIVRSAYSFEFKPSVSNNIVTLEYRFVTYKDHIAPEDIAQYKKDYAKMENVLYYQLSTYSNKLGNNTKVVRTGSNLGIRPVHWPALLVAAIASLLVALGLGRVSRQGTAYTSQTETPDPMTWWMIVLGVIIAIRILIYLYKILFSGYFAASVWNVGSDSFNALLWTELILVSGFCAYSGKLFYWFIKKRDIFPRMFIIFAFSELSVNILLLITGLIFRKDIAVFAPEYVSTIGAATMQSMVFCALWVTVVYTAREMRAVFIVPYRYVQEEDSEQPGYEDVHEQASHSLRDVVRPDGGLHADGEDVRNEP